MAKKHVQRGKEHPLIKRLRRAYSLLERSQTLRFYASAPEGVRLRIDKACALTLEALSEYEPYWEEKYKEIMGDYLVQTGDFNHPRAKASPYYPWRRDDSEPGAGG